MSWCGPLKKKKLPTSVLKTRYLIWNATHRLKPHGFNCEAWKNKNTTKTIRVCWRHLSQSLLHIMSVSFNKLLLQDMIEVPQSSCLIPWRWVRMFGQPLALSAHELQWMEHLVGGSAYYSIQHFAWYYPVSTANAMVPHHLSVSLQFSYVHKLSLYDAAAKHMCICTHRSQAPWSAARVQKSQKLCCN